MGIPLLAGRTFRAGAPRGTPAVDGGERAEGSLYDTEDVGGRGIGMGCGGHAAFT